MKKWIHRPEPSSVKFDSITGERIPQRFSHWIVDRDGHHVGLVGGGLSEPEASEVAQLMAAAPEMFEVLCELSQPHNLAHLTPALAVLIREALAKAKPVKEVANAS